MGRPSRASWAALLALILSLTPQAAKALPVPEGLTADAASTGLHLHWQPVEGAGLYRVAIFDAPESDGKRPLLAAVWVKGTDYDYGHSATVGKAGKFPSTAPLPLPTGRRLRAMVAAAAADGSDKGEWAGIDVEPLKSTPSASPTPGDKGTATPSPTPGQNATEADPQAQGGEEFKQSPDAAVLDVDDAVGDSASPAALAPGSTAAASALASGALAGAALNGTAGQDPAPKGSSSTTFAGSSPIGEAKGLVSAGRFEQAETAYRAILEKEPENADAWEGLGDSYAGRRMKLEAKESYEKALSLNKTKTHLKDWLEKNVRH